MKYTSIEYTTTIGTPRGDVVLELLYEVYAHGSCHGEVGFGSFVEKQASLLLKLFDSGLLDSKMVNLKEVMKKIKELRD